MDSEIFIKGNCNAKVRSVISLFDEACNNAARYGGQGHAEMSVAKSLDQVWIASAGSNDGQRIGERGTKAEPSRLNGAEIREELADAALQKRNLVWIERCGEAAEFDRSRDPQAAGHGREIEAQIDWADGPLDRTGIHRKFDVIAALRIEGDVLAALFGQKLRPGAGGENNRMRIDSEIATDELDLPIVLALQSLDASALKRSAV